MGHFHESISIELMPKPFWSVWERTDLNHILWEVQQKRISEMFKGKGVKDTST